MFQHIHLQTDLRVSTSGRATQSLWIVKAVSSLRDSAAGEPAGNRAGGFGGHRFCLLGL